MKQAAVSNPWPCLRCGSPVAITARAGRLPPSVKIATVAVLMVLYVGLTHWYAGAMTHWGLSLSCLLLGIGWGLLRHNRRAWHCSSCGLFQPARLHAAGDVRTVVCVPTFNNSGSIAQVLRQCADVAPNLPIWVINDGSTDSTGEVAREALETLNHGSECQHQVIDHAVNRGKGAAIVTALKRAFDDGFSHIITLDGDGQHLPKDIPGVLAACHSNPTAIVVGSRDLSDDNVQGASRFGRKFSNFWLRVQTGTGVDDSQSGFRIYPVAAVLSLGLRARRYDFEVEILTVGARAGIPLRSVNIDVHYPPPAERVSHFDKLWDNVRISLLNTKLLIQAPLWALGFPARLRRDPAPSGVIRSWSGRSRGGAFGHAFFIALLRLIGPRPAYPLLHPVVWYFLFAERHNIAKTRQFFTRAMGPCSPWGRLKRAYAQTLVFSRCILDRAVAQMVGSSAFTMRQQGHEYLTNMADGKKGAIILSGHLGNYEVAAALLQSTESDLQVSVVMHDGEAEAIKRVYERMGAVAKMPNIIAINDDEMPGLKILKALRNGELVAMHGDRIVDEHWVPCKFMGHDAPFPTNAFTIAAAARVPVILTFGLHDGGTTYRFIAEEPRTIDLPRGDRDAALRRHVQWYADRLEHWARLYPHQWYNYFDFWKAP